MKNNTAEQLGFSFVAEAEEQKENLRQFECEQRHRASWGYCWGWSGPEASQPCEISSCVPGDGRLNIYAYMERCMLLEERPDGLWLAEIAMGIRDGKPWHKNGTRVLLGIMDIWPPVRDLSVRRDAGRVA